MSNAIAVPAAGNFADARHEHQKLCQEDGAILAMMPEVPRRRRSRITQSAPPRRSGAQRALRSHLSLCYARNDREIQCNDDPNDFFFELEKGDLNVRLYDLSEFSEKREFTFDRFKTDSLDAVH